MAAAPVMKGRAQAGTYRSAADRAAAAAARAGVASTAYQDANERCEGFDRLGLGGDGDGSGGASSIPDFERVDGFGARIDGDGGRREEEEEAVPMAEAAKVMETEAASAAEYEQTGGDGEVAGRGEEGASGHGGTAATRSGGGGASEQAPPPPLYGAREQAASGEAAGAAAESGDGKVADGSLPPQSRSRVGSARGARTPGERRSYARFGAGKEDDDGVGEGVEGGEGIPAAALARHAPREVNATAAAAAAAAAGLPFSAPVLEPTPPPPPGEMPPGLRRLQARAATEQPSTDMEDQDDGELAELRGGRLSASSRARSSTPNGEKALVLGSKHELAPFAVAAGLKWKGLRGRSGRPRPLSGHGTAVGAAAAVAGAAGAVAGAAAAAAGAAAAASQPNKPSQQPRTSAGGTAARNSLAAGGRPLAGT